MRLDPDEERALQELLADWEKESEPILTGDVDDLELLADSLPGVGPRVVAWP